MFGIWHTSGTDTFSLINSKHSLSNHRFKWVTLLQQHRCNSNLVICIVSGTESLWRGTTSWLWHKATDRCRRRDNTISCSFLFIDVINRQRLSSFRIDIEDAGYNRWLTNALLINGSFVSTFSLTQYSIEKLIVIVYEPRKWLSKNTCMSICVWPARASEPLSISWQIHIKHAFFVKI